MQENKPIGTSILLLSVIDQDSFHNGPPFSFKILSGNEGKEFVLEKDGTLVANQVFRRDLETEYVIQIQVELTSGTVIHVRSYHFLALNRSVSFYFVPVAGVRLWETPSVLVLHAHRHSD